MRILLLGGTGFIGSRVLDLLINHKHDVWLLIRDKTRLEEYQHKGCHVILGNAEENGRWIDSLPAELDYIINLVKPDFPSIRITSADMDKKYTPFMTQVAKNITYIASKTNPKRIYQTSRIFYYKPVGIQWINEKAEFNRDPDNWGKLSVGLIKHLLEYKNTPTTFILFGSVVYDSAGTFARNTIPTMYRNQYSIIGNGENWLQLTHIEDAAAGLVHLMEMNFSEQVINIVDDKPIAQKDFFKMIAYKTHSPGPLPIPLFLAKTLYGDIVANSLAESLRVKNDLLKSTGYWLKFPDYQSGLGNLN
jgi:uncharacterized protein